MELRPGLTVNIIVNIDYRKEIVETKNSIVHDVVGSKVIVAQPDPPISRTNIGKEIFLSYLEKEGGRPVRYGFGARIVEFIKDYRLASDKVTQAILLDKVGRTETYNLRMFYRLEPPGDCGIDIFVNGQKASIIDVSIGGASFTHQKVYPFKVNEEVKIVLVVEDRAYEIDARVVRVWESENEKMKKSLEFVSVQFVEMDGLVKNKLGRKIRDIERALRYKELGETEQ